MQELVKVDSKQVMESLSHQDLGTLTPEAYLNSLSIDQIGIVYDQLKKVEKFISGVCKIVEKEVTSGTQVPGLKVVLQQGKTSEGFIAPEDKVAEKLIEMGYSKDAIYKAPSLVSYTNIKNMIKTAGVHQLKEAGLIGPVTKDSKEVVVYVGDLESAEIEEVKGE